MSKQEMAAAKFLAKHFPRKYIWEKYENAMLLIDRTKGKRTHSRSCGFGVQVNGFFGYPPICHYTLDKHKYL